MIQDIFIDLLQLKGSFFEIGKKQGELLKNTALEVNHRKRRVRSMRNYKVDIHRAEQLIRTFSPGFWEELHGLAEGLQWSFDDVIHEYSGYQMDHPRSGCTTMIKNGFFARNYDYHPKTYDGRLVLRKPDKGFGVMGFSNRVVGRIDGMNEHGVVIAYNFVNRTKAVDGFICSSIARFILDSCRSTEEAIKMIKEIPHRHAFIYSIFDSTGKGAVVEASSRHVEVRPLSEFVCTNHFKEAEMIRDNRHHLGNSLERYDYLKEKLDSELNGYDLFSLFNEKDRGVYSGDYRNWNGTIHTSVYDSKKLEMFVGIGGNTKPLKVSLNKWLDGKPLYIKKLRGLVETEEVFPFTKINNNNVMLTNDQ